MFDKFTRGKDGFVLTVLLLFTLASQVQANPRYASIVINADTGTVLHESNADASRYPASLTKMMTLYMLFEAMDQGKITLNTQMSVSAYAASKPQTNIGLRTGDYIRVRDAIPALIVRSANDVAAVIAEALGTSEANFGRMMTDKARNFGMRSTTFRNASGLPNHEQKTTARDMATLSVRLMKDFPQHYHYFSTRSFRYKDVTYNSHNRMVRNTQGVDGLKTGFIRASGFNVATSAKRGDRRLIAVVMGGQTAASRDQHMVQLLDRSFRQVATMQMAGTSGTKGDNKSGNNGSQTSLITVEAPIPVAKPNNIVVDNRPDPAAILRGDLSVVTVAQRQPVRTNNDTWGVQIGSYYEHERAQAQAQAATRWVAGEVVVVEVEISNRRLYRARLIGLQRNQAHNACQSLSRHGMDCMVVRSHG
ncbi:MAG TPA: D-alanyl-D-alanine carboxypeptidase [Nitrosomonas sp.]|nr:D-alanyl-D-alanine carboxypeptidase [Nitrosomonas sp.]